MSLPVAHMEEVAGEDCPSHPIAPMFFVHIPKTAGTSFRLGAEAYFGAHRILYDYGKDSPDTAAIIRSSLYQNSSDFWAFRKECERRQTAMVGGHVNAARYVSLFGIGQTVTFLREPLQRIASDYAHFARHYDYKGSFREFFTRPVMQNRQSKFLQGTELEAIGFAGLTERYAESLEMLNARFGISIPFREENQGRSSLSDLHEISREEREELRRLNRQDIALYERAKILFANRYRLFQEGKVWAHAKLVEVSAQRMAGWAWWENHDDEPVEVEIWINGELIEAVSAVEARPNLQRWLPPRGGFVGFHLPVKLSPGDQVQCRVAATEQPFPLKPRRVLPPKTS